jgi:4'-phosphopantetheinyl transferase
VQQAVECWLVDLQAAAPALHAIERDTPRLSDWDRETASAFSDKQAAAQWLAAHIALRILLERAVGPGLRGVPLERGARIKPHVKDAPVIFSLSHVTGLALIALGPAEPLGVDLERSRVVHMSPHRRAPMEVAAAALNTETALPKADDARFLQTWVRLEAAAKADGCGIGRMLTRLGLTRDSTLSEAERAARARAITQVMRLRDMDLGGGLFAAVATPPGVGRPDVTAFPASPEGLAALLR